MNTLEESVTQFETCCTKRYNLAKEMEKIIQEIKNLEKLPTTTKMIEKELVFVQQLSTLEKELAKANGTHQSVRNNYKEQFEQAMKILDSLEYTQTLSKLQKAVEESLKLGIID